MPIDPSFLPPAASPNDPPAEREPLPVAPVTGTPLAAATPHIGHTVLFGFLVALAGFLVGIVFALALKHVERGEQPGSLGGRITFVPVHDRHVNMLPQARGPPLNAPRLRSDDSVQRAG